MKHKAAVAATPGVQGRTDAMLWLGLILGLAPLCIRATSSITLFPGWDVDPLVSGGIDSGLSPLGSMLCDVVTILGAGLLLLHARAWGARANIPSVLLAAVGAIGVLLHACALSEFPRDLGNARAGGAWLSAIAIGLALAHGAVDPRIRRVTLGVLCGLGVLFALRGSIELFIEHPRQVAAFNADKDRILASHGWTPGSSMALGFERRLSQPEASGWFGLSNVYASFAAAMTTFAFGMLIEWFRTRRRSEAARVSWSVAIWVILLASGLGALYFSQSKGGIIAALAGGCALAALMPIRSLRERAVLASARTQRISAMIGLLAVLGPLAMIAVRSMLGDRLNELSLLFRAFYAEAAIRMFARTPLFGVGPDGFQTAYALAKNPFSPEDPTSPHILVLDYVACLGILGFAWAVLVIRAAVGAGMNSIRQADGERASEFPARTELRVIASIPVVATLCATYLQGLLVTPEIAALRVGGLVAWCVVAIVVARQVASGARVALPLAAAALALLAHSQIDVAGSWLQSAGLVACWVGIAAQVRNLASSRPTPLMRSKVLLATALASVLSASVLCVSVWQAYRWERELARARLAIEPLVSFLNRLELQRESATPGAPRPRESLEAVARDLAAAVNAPPATEPAEFERQMGVLETRLVPKAIALLMKADALDPNDFRARREASRLWTRQSELLRRQGQLAASEQALESAADVLRAHTEQPQQHHPTAGEYYALYQVIERRGTQFSQPAALAEAAGHIEKAIALDLWNLDFVVARYRLSVRMKDGQTQKWAKKALELDGFMKHDREVRGLNEAVARELRQAASP